MIYHFSHSVYYANTELLFGQVTEFVAAAVPPLRWFCIDDIHFTGAAKLRAVHDVLKKAEVKLVFARVSNEVRATLEKYEIAGLLDKDALFDSLRAVVHAYTHTRSGRGGS